MATLALNCCMFPVLFGDIHSNLQGHQQQPAAICCARHPPHISPLLLTSCWHTCTKAAAGTSLACGSEQQPWRCTSSSMVGTNSSSNSKCSIIIPTYNESDNIPILLWLIEEACSKASISYEAIIVDDASPDGTQAAVKQMQQLLGGDKVKLQARPAKLGLGTAYRHGLQYAQGSWIILMDADLSHHPKYIPTLFQVQQQSNADIVTGTRYTAGGGVSGWNWKRKLTSRGANVLASTCLGLHVSDLTGAFRLYRRSVLEQLLRVVTSKGYAFQMEMIARASALGASIAEVPIVFVDRVYGQSKLGRSEYTMFISGLLRLFFTM